MLEHIGEVRSVEESGGHYVAWTRDKEGRWTLHDDESGPMRGEKRFRHPKERMSLNTFMSGIILIVFERKIGVDDRYESVYIL